MLLAPVLPLSWRTGCGVAFRDYMPMTLRSVWRLTVSFAMVVTLEDPLVVLHLCLTGAAG